LSHASQYVTLLPGDVIALGTPPPAPPVSAADLIEAEVEHVGVLRNTMGD
jgi:2-keto-4-pentenoate hydratase/2-oxohepta-3-ene-1,7-dioic acid hydratase in catechol pathway